MTRRFLSVAAVVAALLVVAAGGAIADDTENSTVENATETATPIHVNITERNATATDSPTPTPNATGVEDGEQVGDRIDSELTLLRWEFDGDRFHLTFEADSPTRATIAEAAIISDSDGGTQTTTIADRRILPGEQTISIPVHAMHGEAAVSITTAESIREEEALTVHTGQQGSDPFAPLGGAGGLMAGIGVTVFVAYGSARFLLWKEDRGVSDA